MDNAATTAVYQEVVDEMMPYLIDNYGNPSSAYELGSNNKSAISSSRKIIADTINCDEEEILFTSGGSEADNWAIKGISNIYKGGHIITSRIEHKAVLRTCEYLSRNGFDITYIDPDERGFINPRSIEQAIRPDTFLCSIMMANNEIGTIQPIKAIAKICHDNHILIHTDAVQAYGHIPIDVTDLDVDLLSVSGHKFHAPKGIGFLFCRRWIPIEPLIHGGGQERGIRGGTENVAGIIGMGKAAEIVHFDMNERIKNLTKVRNYMIEKIIDTIPSVIVNGSLVNRVPNNVNITFIGIQSQSAVIMLDDLGINCSAGSACNTGEAKPSHVLTAIGRSTDEASATLRFTLDDYCTIEDVDIAVNAINFVVQQLRATN